MVVILDMLGSGMSYDEIIEDHPSLEIDDIRASLQFETITNYEYCLRKLFLIEFP